MYCKNCGKQIPMGEMCKDCESLVGTTVVNNGEKFDVVSEVNNTNDTNNTNYSNSTNNTYTNNNQNVYYNLENQKSKIAAGLFGIFLGAFGVHNFYLGYTGKAIAQLLITILTCGALSFVSAIWGLIEGILIFTGEIKDAQGNPLKD